MIKQCKGKDLNKIPKSKLDTGLYYSSLKYDGHYVQIHKVGNSVRFFTSGGKEFAHELAEHELVENNPTMDFILEAEFIANTDGKLGNRGKAAKLTTYRTNFEKGIANIGLGTTGDTFKVFDMIVEDVPFKERLGKLQCSIVLSGIIELVEFSLIKLSEAKLISKMAISKGYEGLYLKTPNHLYFPGKRVNNAIKLKLRPTADLKCIGTNPGEGKYEDMIGSLILQDSEGRVVSVGAGLDDNDRRGLTEYYVGKIIEIEYEQILDTYIQPTFKCVRHDKKKAD